MICALVVQMSAGFTHRGHIQALQQRRLVNLYQANARAHQGWEEMEGGKRFVVVEEKRYMNTVD